MIQVRRSWGGALVVGVACLVAASTAASTASAGTAGAADEIAGGHPRVDGALHKLGRGLSNIATAPAELLRVPTLVSRKDGYVAGSTVGLVKGVWLVVVRAVTGVYEVVTFPVEVPKGYGPLLHPEFVWEHGDWNE